MPRVSRAELDPELDPASFDVAEHPGGAVWWTRHTALGVQFVLELPAGPVDVALELLLVQTRSGRTSWVRRTERGASLWPIDGVEA